jgi:uncharacterized membrane protein
MSSSLATFPPALLAPLAAIDGMQLTEVALRWIHVVAGVIWIGMLYFFNFVNTPFAGTMDGETKKKVVPQLMPRALFWFRWGAAYTWITGILLIGMVYYMTETMSDGTKPSGAVSAVGLGGLIVGFLVYDVLAKAMAKQPLAAVAAWFAIGLGFAFALNQMGAGWRFAYLHLGALFGTTMAANVWMRIWPAQRRIITAVKEGKAPDAADPALAGLRSKHNTFMSVPLVFTMLAQHETALYGYEQPLIPLAVVLVVSFAATHVLYGRAAKVQGF